MSKDINVTDGTVLETLNNKVDLDGGNYAGSPLEEYIHEHCGGGAGLQMFDTVLKDHVLTYEESKGLALQGTWVYKEAVAGSRYGYPDFYAKCLEEKESGTVTETTLGDSTITMYINANGHQFYDIADKNAVDTWFDTYGMAWMYGIDTENERVFLPRNNWFEQLTVDVDGVGDSVEAGLPTHKHTRGTMNITGQLTSTSTIYTGGGSGAFNAWRNGDATGNHNGGDQTNTWTYDFDASRSWTGSTSAPDDPIYGKSNTVQPNAVKKLLYICVGNTESQSSVTDVVDVTTTENDTLPLGYSTYQNGVVPNSSWLKSQGQWNDGNLYTTFYNEFVNELGQDFASGKVVEYTDEYTDYDLVINQDDMTFRLPLLDGSEDLPSDRYEDLELLASGSTYTAPANGYYVLDKIRGEGSYAFLMLQDNELKTGDFSNNAFTFYLNLPVKKGNVIIASYDATGATSMFRFIYAQGNGSLYFKVANAVQNLELLDAGEVLEVLSDKISRQDCKAYITESYINNTSGYNVYSNGYCEQWGVLDRGEVTNHGDWNVTLLKPYKDTNYNVIAINGGNTSGGGYGWHVAVNNVSKTTTSFGGYGWKYETSNRYINWQTKGYV